MKNHPTITPHLLYDLIGLKQIDAAFLDFLNGEDPALHDALIKARQNPSCHTDAQESALLTSLTPLLEVFLGDLFGIQAPLETLQKAINEKSIIFQIRRTFIQRRALKNITQENAKNLNGQELAEKLTPHVGAPSFSDLDFARWVQKALADPALVEPLEWAEEYAAWRVWHLEGQLQNPYSSLFHVPRSTDYLNLFPFLKDDSGGIKSHVVDQKPRDGFETPGLEKTFSQALGEAHYCILCHPQNKDSCAKGLLEKGSPTPQKNPLGVALSGCPLKQKISEMNGLFRDGFVIGALGIICIDNPMVAATGYRICNDCRLSCIYQKQDSVDVPSVESQILRTVLELPFGFEIYSLLTRWNPLNIRAPLPQESSGYHILVAGMGPAGFTLSHYLMNAGHRVLGIDGLKIDPLPASLVGMGESYGFELIRDTRALWSSLETREIGGFGGVSEYGITVRWDKNFLTLIRLLLERRRTQFALLGNTRLGGTLTLPQISDLGFDHVALCLGAGSPHTLPLSGGLSKGVRQASDFLMSLHLGAAFQQDSLTNWTLRMPVVVLGGGLTAVDTATEAQSYYIRQAEKFADQYETLVRENGRAHTESDWRTEDREIAQEFLEHAKAIRMERKRAHAAGQSPNFIPLVHQWGGVRILYRRTLQESPAYRLNADEIYAALQEGIIFEENWTPDSMSTDQHGWVESITCANTKNQTQKNYPARTILVAFGANPNLTIFEEKEISIPIEGNRFKKNNCL